MGNLSYRTRLALNRNSLSGSLPTSLDNLSGLAKVSLHDKTGLSGPLPSGFGSTSEPTRLAVSRTGLSRVWETSEPQPTSWQERGDVRATRKPTSCSRAGRSRKHKESGTMGERQTGKSAT